jgi:hypothetical protein
VPAQAQAFPAVVGDPRLGQVRSSLKGEPIRRRDGPYPGGSRPHAPRVRRLPMRASADAVDLRAIVQTAPASKPYGSALARAGCEPESDEPRPNKCCDEVPRLRYRFDYQKARTVAVAVGMSFAEGICLGRRAWARRIPSRCMSDRARTGSKSQCPGRMRRSIGAGMRRSVPSPGAGDHGERGLRVSRIPR